MGLWRRAALLWLIITLVCAAYVGLRFYRDSPVEADLLALLPVTDTHPNGEAAFKALSERLGNRVLFLVGDLQTAVAQAQAGRFADSLRASGHFSRVIDQVPNLDATLLVTAYAPYRGGLLTPEDQALLAGREFDPAAHLLRRIYQAFPVGVPTDPTLDPFGFLQHWLSRLPLAQTSLSVEAGSLVARQDGVTYVLVIGEPAGPGFAAATQDAVVAAVDAAEQSLGAHSGQTRVLRTGALFYGQAARHSAQAEVDFIGGGSLVGILLLMLWLFRSIRPWLLGMGTVALGILCGTAVVLASHGKIHLITLVFGASLIGETVDYSIQYFAAHLDAGPKWQAQAALKRVLPGLGVALATSLVGYGALSLTPFPAVSQIALFAFVGLSAAWISVVLLLPHCVRRASQTDPRRLVGWVHGLLAWWRGHIRPVGVAVGCLGLLIVAVPGWLALAANDDVRMLVARPADLVTQENQIRQITGAGGNGRFFLVEGDSSEAALVREEALTERLRAKIGQGIAGYTALSDFVPSLATQARNRQLLTQAIPPQTVPALFDAQGLQAEAAAKWLAALSAAVPPLNLENWLETPLATGFRFQALSPKEGGRALIVTLRGDDGRLDAAALAAGLPGVSVADKAASVSDLFAQYRKLAARWLPAACVIVLTILALRYGLRQAGAMLLPTLLAMGLALAAYGYAGVSLTLFSMMGLMLTLGIGVNYAIFLVEAGERAPAPFAGVLLSAATTLLSFGLLSVSSMPALHQFGLVLLIGVSASVLLAPIALTLSKD